MFFLLVLIFGCVVPPPDASSFLSGWALKCVSVGIPMFSTETSIVKPAGVPSVEALAAALPSVEALATALPGVEALAIDGLQYPPGSSRRGAGVAGAGVALRRLGAMASRAGGKLSCLT